MITSLKAAIVQPLILSNNFSKFIKCKSWKVNFNENKSLAASNQWGSFTET